MSGEKGIGEESASVKAADAWYIVREARRLARRAKSYRRMAAIQKFDEELFRELREIFVEYGLDKTRTDLYMEITKRAAECAGRKTEFEAKAEYWEQRLAKYKEDLSELLEGSEDLMEVIEHETSGDGEGEDEE